MHTLILSARQKYKMLPTLLEILHELWTTSNRSMAGGLGGHPP